MHTDVKVNGQINVSFVNLVSSTGEMLGKVGIDEARRLALSEKLDLVEVSPSNNGDSPVCKILDYGKWKYEHDKQKKHNKHHQTVKEVKISLNISDHDLKRKAAQVSDFLDKRFKVRYSLELKGRERQHSDSAVKKFSEQVEEFAGKAIWDQVNVSGRTIAVTLRPHI